MRNMPSGAIFRENTVSVTSLYNVAAHWGEVNDDDQLRKNAAYIKKHFVDKGKLGNKTGEGFYKYPTPNLKILIFYNKHFKVNVINLTDQIWGSGLD